MIFGLFNLVLALILSFAGVKIWDAAYSAMHQMIAANLWIGATIALTSAMSCFNNANIAAKKNKA